MRFSDEVPTGQFSDSEAFIRFQEIIDSCG
jgi:hypothetical protein